METIWKYDLDIQKAQAVKMPVVHEILSIQEQGGIIRMWAKVDTSSKIRPFTINMFGTGWNLPEFYTGDFLATVQKGQFVWHFFIDN